MQKYLVISEKCSFCCLILFKQMHCIVNFANWQSHTLIFDCCHLCVYIETKICKNIDNPRE